MWAKGANYKVYDVKTGIVWWAHRWSGGYHVDAEPLTAADTARLCKCYGVTTASEITAKKYFRNIWSVSDWTGREPSRSCLREKN